ncbi:MAG: two-component system, OmpR family, phosphate regulon sensor histidine kinase PhoR [Blastocatellia bacterium]|jgi:signal transduction histidine kinase|nr:two-component system, OmpR family, phosphate regulon sensor histidine kinase PhoR [Blastocatellia bacterium]
MKLKKRSFMGGFNRFRLMLTLGLAVLLPAAALIYVNFSQLRAFERDKVLEAAIHRDFQDRLALTEKRINKKAFALAEEARDNFPSPDDDIHEKEKKLDLVLARSPWLAHVFLLDEKGLVLRSQPQQMSDKFFKDEHDQMISDYHWLTMEGKNSAENLHKRARPNVGVGQTKRSYGEAYLATAMFIFPQLPKERVVIGGATFDPCYLKQTLFSGVLDEMAKLQSDEQGGNPLALMIYAPDADMSKKIEPLAATTGWGDGKYEVMRKFDDSFRGLALAMKYQGTSVAALGQTWVHRSFLILGFLSLMIIGGLVLTRHVVSKEMALARLKSDFVSNVSHELRTPLALIRLYAETLELGRITTTDKKQQYYRIIRKESERLTALINNILDFSRIEAGRKEYEFRETDIAELVHNTLESYRYQIEQQGFAFEESIDEDLPPVRVDREAIARALVNLVNNALKYSAEDKYLGVKLYRENGTLKLEVRDRGIGIARRDQAKIFEKFYRTGDPLVHNTKGSGLGLSLVRHITQAHGGEIAVDSTPGKGSKFTLSLPFTSGTQPAANHAT